jgi:hypothetical protein
VTPGPAPDPAADPVEAELELTEPKPVSPPLVEAVFGATTDKTVSDLDYVKAHWRGLSQVKLFEAFNAANLSACVVTVDGKMIVSRVKIVAAPLDQVNVVRHMIEEFQP